MKETVLIVEDDPDIAECLQYNLDLAGLKTQVVRSPMEAIPLLVNAANAPAVVLLDPHALDVQELDLYARLRSEGKSRSIPLILLTSFTSDITREACFQIAADYYISKPYSMREISSTIEVALSQPKT